MAARKMNGKVKKGKIRKRTRAPLSLPSDYRPSSDEGFMNPLQQEYWLAGGNPCRVDANHHESAGANRAGAGLRGPGVNRDGAFD